MTNPTHDQLRTVAISRCDNGGYLLTGVSTQQSNPEDHNWPKAPEPAYSAAFNDLSDLLAFLEEHQPRARRADQQDSAFFVTSREAQITPQEETTIKRVLRTVKEKVMS